MDVFIIEYGTSHLSNPQTAHPVCLSFSIENPLAKLLRDNSFSVFAFIFFSRLVPIIFLVFESKSWSGIRFTFSIIANDILYLKLVKSRNYCDEFRLLLLLFFFEMLLKRLVYSNRLWILSVIIRDEHRNSLSIEAPNLFLKIVRTIGDSNVSVFQFCLNIVYCTI